MDIDKPLVVSIVSLAVASLALFISWRTYRRDRSDIRVSVEYYPESGRGTQFNVRATNHGRRVAFIEHFRVHFKGEEPIGDSVAGGVRLLEGEVHGFWLPIYGPDGKPIRLPPKIKSVEVFDTLGNAYRFPGCSLSKYLRFRTLKSKIRAHWEKGK